MIYQSKVQTIFLTTIALVTTHNVVFQSYAQAQVTFSNDFFVGSLQNNNIKEEDKTDQQFLFPKLDSYKVSDDDKLLLTKVYQKAGYFDAYYKFCSSLFKDDNEHRDNVDIMGAGLDRTGEVLAKIKLTSAVPKEDYKGWKKNRDEYRKLTEEKININSSKSSKNKCSLSLIEYQEFAGQYSELMSKIYENTGGELPYIQKKNQKNFLIPFVGNYIVSDKEISILSNVYKEAGVFESEYKFCAKEFKKLEDLTPKLNVVIAGLNVTDNIFHNLKAIKAAPKFRLDEWKERRNDSKEKTELELKEFKSLASTEKLIERCNRLIESYDEFAIKNNTPLTDIYLSSGGSSHSLQHQKSGNILKPETEPYRISDEQSSILENAFHDVGEFKVKNKFCRKKLQDIESEEILSNLSRMRAGIRNSEAIFFFVRWARAAQKENYKSWKSIKKKSTIEAKEKLELLERRADFSGLENCKITINKYKDFANKYSPLFSEIYDNTKEKANIRFTRREDAKKYIWDALENNLNSLF